MAGRTADQGAQPRQHFLDVERLGDIVVGAGIDARNLVAPAVAGGEDQHRHLAPGTAPSLENGQPVHLRQADVEDDRVVGLGIAEEMALLAIAGRIDGIAGIGQRCDELAIELGIVFNDENAHGRASPATRERELF